MTCTTGSPCGEEPCVKTLLLATRRFTQRFLLRDCFFLHSVGCKNKTTIYFLQTLLLGRDDCDDCDGNPDLNLADHHCLRILLHFHHKPPSPPFKRPPPHSQTCKWLVTIKSSLIVCFIHLVWSFTLGGSSNQAN